MTLADLWEDHAPEVVIGTLIVLLIIVVAIAAKVEMQEREAFMSDCLQERKQYECTALWRAGRASHTTVVVPR